MLQDLPTSFLRNPVCAMFHSSLTNHCLCLPVAFSFLYSLYPFLFFLLCVVFMHMSMGIYIFEYVKTETRKGKWMSFSITLYLKFFLAGSVTGLARGIVPENCCHPPVLFPTVVRLLECGHSWLFTYLLGSTLRSLCVWSKVLPSKSFPKHTIFSSFKERSHCILQACRNLRFFSPSETS